MVASSARTGGQAQLRACCAGVYNQGQRGVARIRSGKKDQKKMAEGIARQGLTAAYRNGC